MRRMLIGLAAAGVVGLVGLTGSAEAREHGGDHRGGREHAEYRGHRFSGGYYYGRHEHPRWGRRVWDERYNRYHYWDSYRSCWYYWCPEYNCYYPTSYFCQ